MTDPILYSFRRCPYAMRARLALSVAGVRCELREVVLRDKPAEMLALSPKATVPVLQLPDGTVLEESLDIMRWALGHNDPEGWLVGDMADMQGLIDQNDQEFKFYLDGYKYSARYENVDPMEQRAKAEKILNTLNDRISSNGYLSSSHPSLADYAIFPFIRQFAFVDMNWFKSSPYENLAHWLDGFLESDLFMKVMVKHKQWTPEDETVYFPTPLKV